MGLLLQFGFYLFLFIGTIVYCIHMFVDGLVNDYKREQEDERILYEAYNGAAYEKDVLFWMKSTGYPLIGLDNKLSSKYHIKRMPIDDEAEEFIRNWKPDEDYIKRCEEESLKKQLAIQAKYIAKYNKEQGL